MRILKMEKCVVLFSGGVDSTTALYWARRRFKKVYALTIDYGQLHRVEINMARWTAKRINVSHKILHVDLKSIGGSSLLNAKIPLPYPNNMQEIIEAIPSTYVPFRNGILLALAAAWAEVEGAKKIVGGFNAIDSPNYPDTRGVFVQAMEKAINLGTKAATSKDNFEILAPFLNMRKSEIIKAGLSLKVDYAYTISCYSGYERPCRRCSSCLFRQTAWDEIGKKDPLFLRLEQEGKL